MNDYRKRKSRLPPCAKRKKRRGLSLLKYHQSRKFLKANIENCQGDVSPETVVLNIKRKEAGIDPLHTDGVPAVTCEVPANHPLKVASSPLIVTGDPQIVLKEEPVDTDTSSNVPNFETVALPGCSAWTDTVAGGQAASSDLLVSVAPQPPQKICRLCMSSEELIGIFDPVSLLQELSSKITEVCAIPIHEEDGLPQYICQNCVTTVQKFYDFRMQCSVTDVTLKAEQANIVLAHSKKKRKGDYSQFQKLNKRLKANIQSFYDLIDSINEFQDKVQCKLEEAAISSEKPGSSGIQGKRKAERPAQKRAKNAKYSNQSVPVESQIPQTLPDKTSITQLTGSNESSSLISNIKSEPVELEPHIESVFVSSVGADVISTKLEIDEHYVFESGGVTHLCETMSLDKDILDLGQDTVPDLGSEGQSSNLGSEGQSSNLGSEGQSSNLGSEGQSSNLGSEGQSHNLGSEGQSHNLGIEGQSHNLGSEGQSGNLGSEGQSHNLGSEGQSHNLGSEGQSHNLGSEEQSHTHIITDINNEQHVIDHSTKEMVSD